MRSRAEIAFRLKQESANLFLWKFPPRLSTVPGPPRLPDPVAAIQRLAGTSFAEEIVRLAEEIRQHRFPVFGDVIETGPEIHWRRDYIHQVETGTPYFRCVPYLDFDRAGDHKYIWELNRHQHLVVLAQASCFTGDEGYLIEIQRQIESWVAVNPFLCGINWASALEVAFRALSWIWIDHFAGTRFPADFRRLLLLHLYRHGRYLENNLSTYFSPNTHLLGEAVALHALGVLYPDFPGAELWRRQGDRIVQEQMERQVRADGTHFEQSAYYHVYAVDFFLWHALVAKPPETYLNKLGRMAEYLDALLGLSGRLPMIGDDDGGRVFHPYGDRATFGRSSLATCGALLRKPDWIRCTEDLAVQAAWWMGAEALALEPAPPAGAVSVLFPDAGVAVMSAGDVQIAIKAGGFGAGSAGHSHSDALSFVCRQGSREVLIDPGTYTYLARPEWRDRFRGSGAHNTIRIDHRDQAIPAGPFRWLQPARVHIREWSSSPECDRLDAECRFSESVCHRRRFWFFKPDMLLVLDEVDGAAVELLVEQFWHFGTAEDRAAVVFSEAAQPVEAWRSPVFGTKEPGLACSVSVQRILPVRLAAAISFAVPPEALTLAIHGEEPCIEVRIADGRIFKSSRG